MSPLLHYVFFCVVANIIRLSDKTGAFFFAFWAIYPFIGQNGCFSFALWTIYTFIGQNECFCFRFWAIYPFIGQNECFCFPFWAIYSFIGQNRCFSLCVLGDIFIYQTKRVFFLSAEVNIKPHLIEKDYHLHYLK